MSNSRKKHPYIGHTHATSDKADKQIASRCTRRVNASILQSFKDCPAILEDFFPISSLELNGMGTYMFAKDGKQYAGPENRTSWDHSPPRPIRNTQPSKDFVALAYRK